MRLFTSVFCASAMTLASGTAMADNASLTLYGIADTFIRYLDNGGTRSISQLGGGASSSAFGLTGSEQLDRDLKVIFKLESAVNLNNGTLYSDTTALFGSQSWIGFQHEKIGTITLGRQYDPAFYVIYPSDPFRLSDAVSPFNGGLAAIDKKTLATQYNNGRASNSIMYRSPVVGGVQLRAMYSLASTVTQPIPTTKGNALDIGLTYTGYGLYAGLGYGNQRPGTMSFPGLPGALELPSAQYFIAALAYRVSIVNLQLNYYYDRPDNPSPGSLSAQLDSAHPYSLFEVGATLSVTPADSIAVAMLQRNVRGAHDNSLGMEVGYDHYLSKRTTVYARAGLVKNHGSSTAGWIGPTISEPGTRQVLVGVGMSHRF
jgi:general bacterial porin, GBP family